MRSAFGAKRATALPDRKANIENRLWATARYGRGNHEFHDQDQGVRKAIM